MQSSDIKEQISRYGFLSGIINNLDCEIPVIYLSATLLQLRPRIVRFYLTCRTCVLMELIFFKSRTCFFRNVSDFPDPVVKKTYHFSMVFNVCFWLYVAYIGAIMCSHMKGDKCVQCPHSNYSYVNIS